MYDNLGRIVESQPESEWDDAERGWMQALKHYREVATCRLCGLPKEVCRAYDTDGRVAVTAERCHVAAALARKQRSDQRDELDLPESMAYDAAIVYDAPPLGSPDHQTIPEVT